MTSTQVFTFEHGRRDCAPEGPEGGAALLRAVVGGAGRYLGAARGDVVENAARRQHLEPLQRPFRVQREIATCRAVLLGPPSSYIFEESRDGRRRAQAV